ncbi:homocysteine S-methyltransferase family protein [Candidatus Zixiibacteriota bacterium]
MDPFLERISAGETLISDGALGTMLQQMGGYAVCPEELNLSRPDILEEVAHLYAQAGSDIIHTNTFGASPLKLMATDLVDYLVEINQSAVESVRKAVSPDILVSGSIGPTGKLMLMNDTTPQEIEVGYVHQAGILVESGVDLICIETMTDLIEALLAVRAVKEVDSNIPLMAQMTFDPTPHGFRTIMGVSIEEATPRLLDEGVDVVGSNCGYGLDTMIEVARAFREVTDAPLIIQSNAGLPELVDGEVVYSETPEMFADRVPDLLDVGVSVIGGCCGTTPDHIRAIREAVDSRT